MHNEASIPKQIGEFQIVRRVGKGALGIVYEAIQPSTNQRVALKRISSELGLTSKAISRFHREIQVLSQLNHANIVRFFSAGEFWIDAYYTTEYIEGPSLDQLIRGMRLQRAGLGRVEMSDVIKHPLNEYLGWALEFMNPGGAMRTHSPADEDTDNQASGQLPAVALRGRYETIAGMMADVADALAYTHREGIIHRDIKPSNLLLSSDRKLRITDFGLANMLEHPGMTMSGALLGSPMYMSPEQLQAGIRQPDGRTDIYSLGAVLYEWVSLQPPFEGKRRDALVSQIIHNDPAPLRQIDHRIPRDLETICSKAMAKDPANRYQTAQQLALDLGNFANRRRISAKPIGAVVRNIRWFDRHRPLAAGLLAALLLFGVVGRLAYTTFLQTAQDYTQNLEASVNLAIATAFAGEVQATAEAIAKVESLGAEAWISDLLLCQSALSSGNPTLAVEETRRALSTQPESIELKTILGEALFESGNWEDYESIKTELASAVPTTTRERLFLGKWLIHLDFERGYRVLNDAYTAASPELDLLARLMLAPYLRISAQGSFEVEAAEAAFREARLMRYYFRNNSFVALNNFQAHTVLVTVMRHAGRQEDAKPLATTTRELLKDMEATSPNSQSTSLAWAWQGYFMDDGVQRLEAFRTSISKLEKRHVSVPTDLRRAYALELVIQGQLADAEQQLKAVQAAGETASEFLEAILQAGGQAETDEVALQERPVHSKPLDKDIVYRPIGLQILGRPEQARLCFEQISSTIELPIARAAWYQQLIEFGCGKITAEALTAAMDESSYSHFNWSEGHFFIGMKLLSEGRRLAAKEHFERCVQASDFSSRAHCIARMILEMWKADFTWPAWIPVHDADNIHPQQEAKVSGRYVTPVFTTHSV